MRTAIACLSGGPLAAVLLTTPMTSPQEGRDQVTVTHCGLSLGNVTYYCHFPQYEYFLLISSIMRKLMIRNAVKFKKI